MEKKKIILRKIRNCCGTSIKLNFKSTAICGPKLISEIMIQNCIISPLQGSNKNKRKQFYSKNKKMIIHISGFASNRKESPLNNFMEIFKVLILPTV